MKKRSSHDRLIQMVNERCKVMGVEHLFNNIEYNRGTQIEGEIDVYAKQYDNILLFECKSSYSKRNQNKAQDQLDRAERFIQEALHPRRIYKIEVYNYKYPEYKWYK